MAFKKEQLERVVVKRLLKTEHKRGYAEIAVVDWVGDRTTRLLEKREFYLIEDGSAKMGKAKGFNRADFALLIGESKTILSLWDQMAPPAPATPQNESSGVSDDAPAGRPEPC